MTISERKEYVNGAISFADYKRRWESLPAMPLDELASLVVVEDLTRHLNYEQSGPEGYLEELCRQKFYSLPEDWHTLPMLASCEDAANEIASAHTELAPAMREVEKYFSDRVES